MKYLNYPKIIIFLFMVILLCIVTISVIQLQKQNKAAHSGLVENLPNQILDTTATSTVNKSSTTPKLKNDVLEEKFLNNVTSYPSTTINGIEYRLFSFTLYDLPDAHKGGLRLYKKNESSYELIWESSEEIIRAGKERVMFEDINNDSIPEIIALDGPNGTGSAMSLFVYQIVNGAVHTLVPISKYKDNEFSGYIIGSEVFFAVIENDKIPEIIVDRGPDPSVPEDERYIQTEDGFSLREEIIVYDVYTYTNGAYELTKTGVKEEEMQKLLKNVSKDYMKI